MKSLATYAICFRIYSKQYVGNYLINLKSNLAIVIWMSAKIKIKNLFLWDIVNSFVIYFFSVRLFCSFILLFSFFFYKYGKITLYTQTLRKQWEQKWLKTYNLQVIHDKKSVIKFDIFKTIIKIVKNVKPTVKIGKSNCNRLLDRGKRLNITYAFFRDFGC